MSNSTAEALSIFEQVRAAALPLMTGYQTDLEHDKNWVLANPGVPYVHFTRAMGTHIWELPVEDKLFVNALTPHLFGTARPSEIYKGVFELIGGDEFRGNVLVCQVYDGRRLRKRSADQGLEDYRKALEVAERGVRRRRQSQDAA